MTQPTAPSAPRRPVRDFGSHLARMPRWHKIALLLAVVLAIVGIVGQSKTSTSSPEPSSASPTNSRGFVSSNPDQPPPPTPAPTLSNKLSRYATHVGLLFLAGFVLGYALRAFLKITATLTLGAIAILTLLSYFHILNVDLTAATEKQIKSESSWLTDQATRLKDSLLAHFHGSVSTAAGAFLGFRRRK